MARSVTYTCDRCGVSKKEANHWWLMLVAHEVAWYTEQLKGQMLVLMPWSLAEAERSNPEGQKFYLCGEECVQKQVSEFMASRIYRV